MKRSFFAHKASPRMALATISVLSLHACGDDDSPTVVMELDSGVMTDAGTPSHSTSKPSTSTVATHTNDSDGGTIGSTSSTSTSTSVASSSGIEESESSETMTSTADASVTEATSTETMTSTPDASVTEITSTELTSEEVSDASVVDASETLDASTPESTTTSDATSVVLDGSAGDGGPADGGSDGSADDGGMLLDAGADSMTADASVDGSSLIDTGANNSCDNNVMDGDETGVDCGGSCNGCVGTECTNNEECASNLCSNDICILPAGQAPTLPVGTLTNFERFQVASNFVDLPVTLHSSASVTFGNKVYILGGSIDGSTSSAIYEATLDEDGLFEAFALNTTYHLATARYAHKAEIVGGYVYVFSGMGTGGLLDTVERAPLGANGIAGDFEVVTGVNLNTARRYFALVTTPSYVYVLGGNYPQLNTVERAPVDQLGALTGSFTTLTRIDIDSNTAQDGMKEARWTHASARIGDNIYFVGGESMSSVEKTTIQGNGSLGNFVLHNPLPSNRNRVNVAILGDRIYAFGGWNGGFLSTIEEAAITDDEVGTWSTTSLTLAEPVENGTVVQTDAAVYLFGGSSGVARNYIQRAFIQPL